MIIGFIPEKTEKEIVENLERMVETTVEVKEQPKKKKTTKKNDK